MILPHFLEIITPRGTVTYTAREVPPNALRATPERTSTLLNRLSGAGILMHASSDTGTRLRLAHPNDEYVLTHDQAQLLQELRIGERVTVRETLTHRRTLRVWQDAIVVSPPDLTWIAGDTEDAWYTVNTLDLIHLEA